MLSAFLKIEGIDGEVIEPKYKNWIAVHGWSFGQSQRGSSAFGTGAAAGKVEMEDFHFNKSFDRSSVKLFESCATGQFINSATLAVVRAGMADGESQEYFRIDFTGLIISSYQTAGSAGDHGLPSESISFNFARNVNTFTSQKDGIGQGSMIAGYDVKTGQALNA